MRLVEMLAGQGNVVAMTGDGVNDAPALKRADIGVAMGITGTEVTKEAADMILTDDNFATIVTAVEGGRGIYDNLMKYVRVQLIMLGGFILTFVGAGIFDVAGGAPLNPLQILWINFAVDVVLAIGLGFDASVPGLMQRAPRDASAPIVNRALGFRLGVVERRDGCARARRGRVGRASVRPRRRDDDGPHDALADARRRGARVAGADRDDLPPLHARKPSIRAVDRDRARAHVPRDRARPAPADLRHRLADELAVGHLPARPARVPRGRRARQAPRPAHGGACGAPVAIEA